MLVARISGIPQLDAVTIIARDGRLLNFSRYQPVPPVNVADRDYFKVLSTDSSRLTFIGLPVENRGMAARPSTWPAGSPRRRDSSWAWCSGP